MRAGCASKGLKCLQKFLTADKKAEGKESIAGRYILVDGKGSLFACRAIQTVTGAERDREGQKMQQHCYIQINQLI